MDTKTTPESLSSTKNSEITNLSYEEARAKLVEIVARLEQGNIPLEESIQLWELGEALAKHCEAWLDGARERLAKAQARTSENLIAEDTLVNHSQTETDHH